MISDGTKNFWKYQLAVWLSIQNLYLHFAKVTCKCECFGRNVEPCKVPIFMLYNVFTNIGDTKYTFHDNLPVFMNKASIYKYLLFLSKNK